MKDFTNFLRKRILYIFEDNSGKTIGFNEKNYLKKTDMIKSILFCFKRNDVC